MVQWSEVQAALGGVYTQLTVALETYYDYTLEQLPASNYETNATDLPSIFKDGEFASQSVVTNVPVLTESGIYSTFASSGINALWAQDLVFIIKISDSSYGKGAGAACKAFPTMTVCVDGVAFIFARWSWTTMSPIDETSDINNYLDARSWQVWGAYAEGSAGGTPNVDQLTQYNLDLPTILTSVHKVLAINATYPFLNQNGATIAQLDDHTTDLTEANLAFFSLPQCDIDSILGPSRHLNGPGDETGDDPIVRWGACTCVQQSTWPASFYPDNNSGYVLSDCQSMGWGNNS